MVGLYFYPVGNCPWWGVVLEPPRWLVHVSRLVYALLCAWCAVNTCGIYRNACCCVRSLLECDNASCLIASVTDCETALVFLWVSSDELHLSCFIKLILHNSLSSSSSAKFISDTNNVIANQTFLVRFKTQQMSSVQVALPLTHEEMCIFSNE